MSVASSSSYSYPLLAVFWTIFEVFLFVIWFWILIWVFIDIFRSPDLSGLAKALWFLFVLFIPLVGGPGLPDRPRREHAREGRAVGPRQDKAFRSQVRETASAPRPAQQTSWRSSPSLASARMDDLGAKAPPQPLPSMSKYSAGICAETTR